MSDIYNPKLRVKFLRNATMEGTPVNPGNLIIDMDNDKIYFDVLSTDNTAKRINISGGVTWKGSVASYSALPKNASNGDMYNVRDTGANYIWSEFDNAWDKLSENIDLSGLYTKTEADAKFVSEANIKSLITQLDNAAI